MSLGLPPVVVLADMVKQIPLLGLALIVDSIFSGVLLTRAIIRLIEAF